MEKIMDKEYREVSQPKAKEMFSEPNDLDESLKDLEDYEDYTNTDNLFQSEKGDRLVVEKHKPYEDAEKAKVDKKASKSQQEKVKEYTDVYDKDNFDKGLLTDPKEIDELLESEEAFSKHLDIQ